MRYVRWFALLVAACGVLAGSLPARAAKRDAAAWPSAYLKADFHNLAKLRQLYKNFAARYAKGRRARISAGELLAASNVAYNLWQVTADEKERKRYASSAFTWASDAHDRDPLNSDAAFQRARTQLANVETQGFLRSLPSIGNIEQLALKVYFQEPGYFYGSAPALLGRLYQTAPSVSLGDKVRAVEMFEQALSEDKRQIGALLGLARSALSRGDAETAKRQLERVLAAPAWNPGRSWYEKDMDFRWHVGQLKALVALRRLRAGDLPVEVAEKFDALPPDMTRGDLAAMVRKARKAKR